MIPKEIKYNLQYDDVRGDFVRLPHAQTQQALFISKSNQQYDDVRGDFVRPPRAQTQQALFISLYGDLLVSKYHRLN